MSHQDTTAKVQISVSSLQLLDKGIKHFFISSDFSKSSLDFSSPTIFKSVDKIIRHSTSLAEVSTRIVEHYAEALALTNVQENFINLIQPTLTRMKVGYQKIEKFYKSSLMVSSISMGFVTKIFG